MAELTTTVDLTTAEELIQELLPVTGRIWSNFRSGKSFGDWIFRGQRDATWGLQPRAFRPNVFDDLPPPHNASPAWGKSREDLEHHYVMRFADIADDLGFHVPGDTPGMRDDRPKPRAIIQGGSPILFPATEYLYMYALAQHYGIPTRLLDWTLEPLTAAYFAATGFVKTGQGGRLAVWAMLRSAVSKAIGPGMWRERHEPFVSFIAPPTASNPNLAAQAGCFSLVHDPHENTNEQTPRNPPDAPRNLDDLVTVLAHRFSALNEPFLYKFTLPEAEIPRLINYLHEHRVHAGTIYPGLSGCVAALHEMKRYGIPLS